MGAMRLRLRRPARPTRPDPARVAGWRLPRASGRATAVGTLAGGARAHVDPAGLVTLAGAGWSLDWWIGAEDRWHLPAEEVAVRQRLQSGAPVVETRVRIPSGDAVHRVYGARSASGADVVVVEVVNESKVPFALALALRPLTPGAVGRIEQIGVDGRVASVDGGPVLVAARAPGRLALGTGADGDTADVVLGGDAGEVGGGATVACPEGLASGALLFPLAHTATLRVVLPLDGAVVEPAEVPGADDVASGWSRQAGQGARIELPDRRLRDGVAASTRHLLLAERRPAVLVGLDLLGLHGETRPALAADPAELAATAEPGGLLHALVRHLELTGETDLAPAAVDVVGPLVARLADDLDEADRSLGVAALPAAGRLLDAAGERRAADDVRALAAREVGTASGADLRTLLDDASGTWSWPGPAGPHDPAGNARFVALVRDLLVEETDAGLDLAPEVPDPWLGQGWEAHDLPTRHGALSYAVRWHGDRPALLWQIDRHPGVDRVVLRAPGLDPTWSTEAPEGEALLGPVALPEQAPRRGITMPVTIEPLRRREP